MPNLDPTATLWVRHGPVMRLQPKTVPALTAAEPHGNENTWEMPAIMETVPLGRTDTAPKWLGKVKPLAKGLCTT